MVRFVPSEFDPGGTGGVSLRLEPPREENNGGFFGSIIEFASNDVPDFFTEDVPDFFTEDIPDFFTEDIPDIAGNVSKSASDAFQRTNEVISDVVFGPDGYLFLPGLGPGTQGRDADGDGRVDNYTFQRQADSLAEGASAAVSAVSGFGNWLLIVLLVVAFIAFQGRKAVSG